MKYGDHNFAGNFHNASGLGQTEISLQMLADEVAELVHTNPREVKDMLIAAGVSMPGKHTPEEIATIAIDSLSNEKFVKALSILIAKAHVGRQGKYDRVLSADATPSAAPAAGGGLFGAIGSVAGMLAGPLANIGAKKRNQDATKQMVLQALAQKNAAKAAGSGAPKKAGMSMGAIIGIAAGAALVIGGIIFAVTRKPGASAPAATAPAIGGV
jgi:hypothetical protein